MQCLVSIKQVCDRVAKVFQAGDWEDPPAAVRSLEPVIRPCVFCVTTDRKHFLKITPAHGQVLQPPFPGRRREEGTGDRNDNISHIEAAALK